MLDDFFPNAPDAVRSRDVPAAPRAGISLLDACPDLGRAVPDADRRLAARVLMARAREFEVGEVLTDDVGAFGWLLVEGLVLRRTRVGERPASELLGPEDILDLRAVDDDSTIPGTTEHVAQRPVTVAVLDDRFRMAARRWPGLYDVVVAQQSLQTRRSSRLLAASLGLTRVEDRLAALFAEFGDRWGRVTADGVVVEVALTHGLLGELVGSKRPTVSLALTHLEADGAVRRRRGGVWVIDMARCAALVQADARPRMPDLTI